MGGFAAALSLIQSLIDLFTTPSSYGIAIWLLAVIFAWSGLVKVRRPVAAAIAMVNFGVTQRIQPIWGGALGYVECLIAVALALRLFPHLVLVITALLLWLFMFLIARSLWIGEQFACFCFGDSDATLSRWTLIRTLVLALLASFLALMALTERTRPILTEMLLQALVALSLLGTTVLIGYIPQLLTWRRDATGAQILIK